MVVKLLNIVARWDYQCCQGTLKFCRRIWKTRPIGNATGISLLGLNNLVKPAEKSGKSWQHDSCSAASYIDDLCLIARPKPGHCHRQEGGPGSSLLLQRSFASLFQILFQLISLLTAWRNEISYYLLFYLFREGLNYSRLQREFGKWHTG